MAHHTLLNQTTDASRIGRRLALRCLPMGLWSLWRPASAQNERPFIFVYGDPLPPLSYTENGVLKGGSVRVIDELLNKRLKLSVTHQGFPWARAQAMVRSGDADALLGAYTPERAGYTVPTEEWLRQARLGAFVSARNPQWASVQKLSSLSDLAPLKLAYVLGNEWAQSVLADHRNLHSSPTREAAFRLLLAGRIDALVDVEVPTNMAISASGLESEVKMLPVTLATEEVKICVGNHSPLVAHIPAIDQTIRAMRKEGVISRLFKG